MYIGSTGPRGLHHLVYEIVDNSVDEALAGYCDTIDVTILADGGVRVDRQRPRHPGRHPQDRGKSTVEVVLTVLHAGGKFGGGGYAVSGGLHGVGTSVVNALSSRLDVEVQRQGYVWRQSLPRRRARGSARAGRGDRRDRHHDHVLAERRRSSRPSSSTTRRCAPASSRWRSSTRACASTLTDERRGSRRGRGRRAGRRTRTTSSSTSAVSSTTSSTSTARKKAELVNDEIISFESEDTERKIALEVAMQWTTRYTESVLTYANTINTHEGGTHEEGFRAALTTLVNKYAREKGILKEKDDNLSGDDVREGLTAVISVKLVRAAVRGPDQDQARQHRGEGVRAEGRRRPARRLVRPQPDPGARTSSARRIQAATARLAARKARETDPAQGPARGRRRCPASSRTASRRTRRISEIFLVEGDSAGGSAVQGRNPETQAILPLRGKILNVEKARLDRALGNNEVQAMITAFGTGIGEDFDTEKARYHKIVLMADADVDGQHITTLLLTLLFRYMRPLIELGYVYLAQPPLYRLKWTNADARVRLQRPRARRAARRRRRRAASASRRTTASSATRVSARWTTKELWETTMNPETRTLLQVTLDDAAAADEIFSTLMGEDVESRRNFIQQNAKDVRFLDI